MESQIATQVQHEIETGFAKLGLGLKMQSLGSMVCSQLGFRYWSSALRGLGFEGCGIQGLGFRI